MKGRLKTILGPIILAATIVAFVYYIKQHPATVDQILQLPPLTVVVLLGLYLVVFLAYAMVTRASLGIYDKKMSIQENILFNAYSSLINFFGPGQSGPVFRGAYLKKRHGLSVRQFMFTTFIYLGFYAVLSALLMFVGSRPWWQTVLLMAVISAASLAWIWRYKQRAKIGAVRGFTLGNVSWIFGATAIQVLAVVIIYGVELQRVGAGASIGQVMSYTGVANFSLFVALTPGAIGIREAFLVFSQNLHHLGSNIIVAANVIDRAVYLVFLGLLFILVLALHAKKKLGVERLQAEDADK